MSRLMSSHISVIFLFCALIIVQFRNQDLNKQQVGFEERLTKLEIRVDKLCKDMGC